MARPARQVHLVDYPAGEVTPAHFVTVDVEVPDPAPGQVLVRNTFTSVDPGMRLRLRESGPAGYFNSFPLNAPVRAARASARRSVWRPAGDRRQDCDLRRQPAGRHHPPQRRGQCVVPDERRGTGRLSVRCAVGDVYGTHGNARVERGLEDRRGEPALVLAAPRTALGKDDHPGAGGERRGDGPYGAGQRPQPFALHEERAAPGGQHTQHRPAPDLALGQHPPREDGGEERDVQPGDVVGDDQHSAARAPGRAPARDTDPRPEDPQDRMGPRPGEPVPYGRTQQGERWCEQRPGQNEKDPRQQPAHRGRYPGHGAAVGGAGVRGTGRAGQPDAHAPGRGRGSAADSAG